MKIIKLEEPKPRVFPLHYSNPSSQGSLLCQTPNFPKQVDTDKYTVSDGYFDRIRNWYPDGYRKALDTLKGHSTDALPRLSDDELRIFAQTLFELNDPPKHIRVIYYYNVATGYDVPYIIAITKKTIGGNQ